MISNLMLVAISIDRYIAVRFPFLVSRICTRARAVAASTVVILLSISINVWYFYMKKKFKSIGDSVGYYSHAEIYRLILYSVLVIIPACFLCAINFSIILIIVKYGKRQSSIATSQRKENDTTKMMLFIVFVFFITHVPFFVTFSHEMFECARNHLNINLLIFCVLHAFDFSLVNSASTFILYYVFSTRYRTEVKKLCCGIKDQDRRQSSTSRTPFSNAGSRRASRRKTTSTLIISEV